MYEAVVSRLEHRAAAGLYHSALLVGPEDGRYVVESAPAWGDGSERGVVAEGAVGCRALGALRLFRYEVRCWRGGVIPDVAEAVDSPRRLSDDVAVAERIVALAPQLPTPVWGRDELRAGEMWNSNSIVAWLLARAGLDAAAVRPPAGGRAPGWAAGVAVAARPAASPSARSALAAR